MELALLYTLPVTDGVALEAYVAPAGEPALGPVAFLHRVSAISDPLAPITHHWQDSTHIAYGVLTVGIFTKQLKAPVLGQELPRRPDDARAKNGSGRAPFRSSSRRPEHRP